MTCDRNKTLLVATEPKEAKWSRWLLETIQRCEWRLESKETGKQLALYPDEARANSSQKWTGAAYLVPVFFQVFFLN